ncbi:Ras family protein [Entamoeba nuttalli P19]|uniref:Ras family protein n=2 Tax=Entamoeba nuttalli TaxID=412467 RepID=K2GFP3_ENTNP|nr:Ras family protein [Entamoeba nuttalli P19]EKE41516.1 Ras family protein [Entamoeba nuttalli P19]|eukprot:XP_008856142.1 Ras family protein [Entamoeba nuttalli P19]
MLFKTLQSYTFVLVGPMSSGKSSLLNCLIEQKSCSYSSSTVTNRLEVVMFENEEEAIKLEILDTPGMKLYESLSHLFFSTTSCILIVVDLSERKYEKQIDEIFASMQKIQNSCSSSGLTFSSSSDSDFKYGFPMVVVGTKSDLVSQDDCQSFIQKVKDNGFISFTCSTNDIESINNVFNDLLETDFVHPQQVKKIPLKQKKKSWKKVKTQCVVL